jgi:hypothetical protein
VFLVNSRHRHFTAAFFGSRSKSFHLIKAHLLPKLRCHFAEFLNQGYLKRLRMLSSPTCVGLQYGHQNDSLRGFSWQSGISHFAGQSPSYSPLGVWNGRADLPTLPAYRLEPGRPTPGWPTLLRPPFAQASSWWYRNINRFPITYAFRPRLRGRLTLRRLPLLRKP